jgi:hypothetical protein
MKAIAGSRAAEMCSNAAGVLAVLIIGGTTAAVWHPNQQLAHSVAEIDYMALVLNVAFPAALFTLVAATVIKIKRKSFHPLGFIMFAALLLGVCACAMAMYGGYVAAHPGANLWSRIWWYQLAS